MSYKKGLIKRFLTGVCYPKITRFELELSFDETKKFLQSKFDEKNSVFKNKRIDGEFTSNHAFLIYPPFRLSFRGYRGIATGRLHIINENKTLIEINSMAGLLMFLLFILVFLFGLALLLLYFLKSYEIVFIVGGLVLILSSFIGTLMSKSMNSGIVEDFSDFIREKSKA